MLDENENTPESAPQAVPAPETPPHDAGEPEAAPAKKAAKKTTKKAPAKKATSRAAAKKTAGKPDEAADASASADPGAVDPTVATSGDAPAAPPRKTAKKAAKKTTKKSAAAPETPLDAGDGSLDAAQASDGASDGAGPSSPTIPLFKAPEPTPRKRAAKKTTKTARSTESTDSAETADLAPDDAAQPSEGEASAPEDAAPKRTRSRSGSRSQRGGEASDSTDTASTASTGTSDSESTDLPDAGSADAGSADADGTDDADGDGDSDGDSDGGGGNRRRRRRGGRRRRKSTGEDSEGSDGSDGTEDDAADDEGDEGSDQDASGGKKSGGRSGGRQSGGRQSGGRDNGRDGGGRNNNGGGGKDSKGPQDTDDADQTDDGEGTGSRRRRRRRRSGEDGDGGNDDPQNTVTRVRKPRNAEDEITSLSGSTRLEAKKQRRREGREAGRRRAPIVSEAEFLARREAVDRVMVIRQRADLTQIAVLEDKVLVEHYVARDSQTSLIGNVYLGRVQNVLPSMEAAFIDIGKGRNAVLYAGEVNWDALGAGNGPRKIEQVLKSGQPILVQVSKDPIGHKGARLTSQVSLPGRFLVYVPDGTTSGISRKLPDTERSRLKTLLKEIVPDSAGVIVRTAAEGASEEELTKDVERLTARWADIEAQVEKASSGGGSSPQLLYGEPDLTLKVVRDLFTEDFAKLVISGGDAWDVVDTYVENVAPDLAERLERFDDDEDVFAAYRIDEQIAKGLDRKVWLPSGGSLIIDRTEAMTVVDVNTGKFTGSGGNLEETVTKNNLEAAEEMVRQLRLRDIGGIIVVDFIDMVLESNRDLVLRRMVECLGRDRTRHQVAEVTSLGLVQMTRKRIGTGLLEAFSENCEHCQGRGLITHHEPVEPKKGKQDDEPRRGGGGARRTGRGRKGEDTDAGNGNGGGNGTGTGRAPSPKDVAAMARHEPRPAEDGPPAPETAPETAPQTGPEPASGPAPSEAAAPEREPAPQASTETPGAPDHQPDAPETGGAGPPAGPGGRPAGRVGSGAARARADDASARHLLATSGGPSTCRSAGGCGDPRRGLEPAPGRRRQPSSQPSSEPSDAPPTGEAKVEA